MPSLSPSRIALLLGSGLIAAGAAAWVLNREASTLRLVDNSSSIGKRLSERARDGQPPPTDPAEAGRLLPGLLRSEVDRKVAKMFFPAFPAKEFDPDFAVLFRPTPHVKSRVRFAEHPKNRFWNRFNDWGMREDEDVRLDGFHTRILFQGDSHAQGVCASKETTASQLERLLAPDDVGAVDVLNVARGGYHPLNYVGTLEAYAELRPDAVVLMLFGGNDFSGACALFDYLFRLPNAVPASGGDAMVRLTQAASVSERGQELNQAVYFLDRPTYEDKARWISTAVALELQRQCHEAGVSLLVAYLPAPSHGAPSFYREPLRERLQAAQLDPQALAISQRIGRAWLESLREHDIATVDLTATLAASTARPYWETDLHLSVQGHRLAAEAIAEVLEPLLAR